MSIILVGIFYVLLSISISNLSTKVDRLEEKLDKLLEKEGLSTNYEVSDELKSKLIDLIIENKKVKAVKLLREESNLDLVDAKNYIDKINDEIN